MKIASVELSIIDSDPRANFDNLTKIIKNLNSSEKDLDFVLLPELWTSGYVTDDWTKISATSQITLEKMKILAKQNKLGFGFSMLFNDEVGMRNRFFVIDKNGNETGFYDKSHLFKPMNEHYFLKAGNQTIKFKLGEFLASPSICYDLRFPEMYRKLALEGVNLFLVSAEWPKPRCETFLTLAKARAIENQAFLILSNRTGIDSKSVEYCGSSAIIYPDGTINFAKNNIVIDSLNLEYISKAKKFIQPLDERIKNIDY